MYQKAKWQLAQIPEQQNSHELPSPCPPIRPLPAP